MTTILHIDASASDANTSHSRRLSASLVEKLKAKHQDVIVTRRDVVAQKLPHVDTTIRQAWTPDSERTAALDEVATRSRTLVDELKSADIIVIGSPMYNFTVPSTLKSWIDHVAIAGQTFRYTDAGAEGLLGGKKVYLALSSGGIYTQGPFQGFEHLATYLTAVLNFMGITDIETIRAEGIAYGPEQDEAAMNAARSRIDKLVNA